MSWPFSSKESALTPEKVPTPPLAAQGPELSPLEIEMPLPPSTRGRTSRPEMMMGFSACTTLYAFSSVPRRGSAQEGRRIVRDDAVHAPAAQPGRERRVVDRIDGEPVAEPADLRRPFGRHILRRAMHAGAIQAPCRRTPIRGLAPEEQAARDLGRPVARRGQTVPGKAREQRPWPALRPAPPQAGDHRGGGLDLAARTGLDLDIGIQAAFLQEADG